jgi:hypothetical protein
MAIQIASRAEHVAGANYLVCINSRETHTADTEAEVWEIIGRQPFGSGYLVTSPAGLDVYDFIPY